MDNSSNASKPGRPRRRRKLANTAKRENTSPAQPGMAGGRFKPLLDSDLPQLDKAVRQILTRTGLSDAPHEVRTLICKNGGRINQDGRLAYSDQLIDRFLTDCCRNFSIYGQTENHTLYLSGQRVYLGTGGAAPHVVDLETGRYRDATLRDLFDAARLVDRLENIHFFSRSLVARDIQDPWLLDLNTAYASLSGTAKHVSTSISQAMFVPRLAELFYLLAGSRDVFESRPFVSLNINHVVPPLRFHPESMAVLGQAVRAGIPVHCNVFSQVGASTPVTLAGAVVQSTAEALAGMIYAWLVNSDAKIIMGMRPMITDLRTGGMAGGSGEQGLLMAATAQMARYYDLPNSSIAGATDSKVADAQSGYEKGITVTLAAQAGSNMVTQASGMHAGLMAVAFESYLIDNEMLGNVIRTLAPIEIDPTTLATEMIDQTVQEDGHFLGHSETYKRMETDFYYPKLADRRAIELWEADGGLDIRVVARHQATEMLAKPVPNHIDPTLDRLIKAKYDIRL